MTEYIIVCGSQKHTVGDLITAREIAQTYIINKNRTGVYAYIYVGKDMDSSILKYEIAPKFRTKPSDYLGKGYQFYENTLDSKGNIIDYRPINLDGTVNRFYTKRRA